MTGHTGNVQLLPCMDSEEMAAARRSELNVSHERAAELGWSAVEAAKQGHYVNLSGEHVDWSAMVDAACSAKISIPPDASLPAPGTLAVSETRVQVTNETTMLASRRLFESGLKPLALNFANGVNPGGGFLYGARAQEEVLCRSSALFSTLIDDPMYDHHRDRPLPDSTAWAILSPDVPVFRQDDGAELDQPWPLSFITCAAPYAPDVGQPRSGDLLCRRIHRVLSIAKTYRFDTLVLGAWGCGAFANDAHRTSTDFRRIIETEFIGDFSDIVFAITDWSPARRYLGPFRDAFAK